MNVVFEFKKAINKDFIRERLQSFVFPKVGQIKWEQMPEKLSAVLATSDGQPVGLVLGVFFSDIKTFRIISLFVTAAYRRKGIGCKLVKLFQQNTKEQCSEIVAFYRKHWKSVESIESLFVSLNWHAPSIDIRILQTKVSALQSLYQNLPGLNDERIRLTTWVNLRTSDKQKIQDIIQQQLVPEYLNPFLSYKSLHPEISLLLLYKEQVAGWLCVNQISANSYEYSTFYISQACKIFKLPVILMKTAVSRQHELVGESNVIAMVRASNTGMTQFLELVAQKSNIELKYIMKVYHMN